MKKIKLITTVICTVLVLSLLKEKESVAQVQHAFNPVSTDCYTLYKPGGQPPSDVGDSNNCVLGGLSCADNTCPSGTMEVQTHNPKPE